MEYARGNLLFWYGDLPHSLADLKQATQRSADLDLSTAVMAWLRLGQVYDLLGDHDRSHEAYRSAMATAPRSEPAKEAEVLPRAALPASQPLKCPALRRNRPELHFT